eukprot:COSAG02_NODE_36100_length_459_cov_0.566667_1_plen_65_part_10
MDAYTVLIELPGSRIDIIVCAGLALANLLSEQAPSSVAVMAVLRSPTNRFLHENPFSFSSGRDCC